MKLTDEQIEKAVNWWGDKVTTPRFDALSNEERKNSENNSMMFAEMLAYMAVKPVTQEQREKFIESLREQLKDYSYGSLDVDYGPCTALLNAAKASGVSENNFPWKTTMLFRDGKVKVAYGYRGEWEEL